MATSALAEEEVRAELARAKLEQVRARRALILAESDLFRARDEAQRALDLEAAASSAQAASVAARLEVVDGAVREVEREAELGAAALERVTAAEARHAVRVAEDEATLMSLGRLREEVVVLRKAMVRSVLEPRDLHGRRGAALAEPEGPGAKRRHVGRKSVASQAAARLEAVFFAGGGPTAPPGEKRPGSQRRRRVQLGADKVHGGKLAALLADAHEQAADLRVARKPAPVAPPDRDHRGDLVVRRAAGDDDMRPAARRARLEELRAALEAEVEKRRDHMRALRDAYEQLAAVGAGAADEPPLERRLAALLLPDAPDPVPSVVITRLATIMAA